MTDVSRAGSFGGIGADLHFLEPTVSDWLGDSNALKNQSSKNGAEGGEVCERLTSHTVAGQLTRS